MSKKIAIVGAGPAGLISGMYLANTDNEVIIFERKDKIVSTPCGEGISHTATEIIKQNTGFDSEPFFSNKVHGLKNFFPKNKIAYINIAGYVLERQKWLEGMQKHFEKQGGKIVFEKNIQHINELLNYDYIVGADGPNSCLRKYTNGKVKVVPAAQYKMKLDWENKDWLEFYWDKDVSSYYSWNFPKKDYYNVGVIGTFAHLAKFIEKYNIRGTILKKEAYPIPFNGVGIQEKNIALIGDAAGMANPFSKGGLAVIAYASQILTQCIRNDSLQDYEKLVKKHKAFSNLYGEVCETINNINQKDLEFIGDIVHGKEMLTMPLNNYFKVLAHPKIIPALLTFYMGFKEGIVYGW